MADDRLAGQSERRGIDIFGVASGLGGRDPGAARAAEAMQAAGLAERLRDSGARADWVARFEPTGAERRSATQAMTRINPQLASAVRDSIAAGNRALVIGGDHSCAVGTWSGAHAALRPSGDMGLIWIDAHLDSHTPETSHTGLLYGMPLAVLLGHGDTAFTGCLHPEPKVKPQHVCVLGARSYEPEERALLDRIGVRVIGMEEVERRGVATVFAEAIDIARRASAGYGITFDLDALDPRDAPGVGTRAVGGLPAAALIEALAVVRGDDRLHALEIAELNPRRDRAGKTLEHALAIACQALGTNRAAPRARRTMRVA